MVAGDGEGGLRSEIIEASVEGCGEVSAVVRQWWKGQCGRASRKTSSFWSFSSFGPGNDESIEDEMMEY